MHLLVITPYRFAEVICVIYVYITNDNDDRFTALPLVKPRPPTATSIPAILKSLQDEWVLTSHFVHIH